MKHGEWIELREDEGDGFRGSILTDELFFRGHCDENDLEWGDIEDLCDWDDGTPLRNVYGRLQHVYGRWIPHPEGGSRWSWQRHPGRGAFPVTRLMETYTANERRLRRRKIKAAKRAARKRWPDAEIAAVWPCARDRTRVRLRFDWLRYPVTWTVGDNTVMVAQFDVESWQKLAEGR